MLTTLADGLRRHFPGCDLYRIGSDEFIVLARYESPEFFRQHIRLLRDELHGHEYEISVGLASAPNTQKLACMVTKAETAMRENKTEFYRQNGNARRYGEELVCPVDLPAFNAICDYDYIRKALQLQSELKLVHQKKNGVKVRLRILRLDHEGEPKDAIWMLM